jgi:PIN domain nuclease of toxin-antitoxin system
VGGSDACVGWEIGFAFSNQTVDGQGTFNTRVKLLHLSPSIAVESTILPSEFHKDPADRLIVATARVHDCPLMTADAKILAYPHVKLAIPEYPKSADD